jgi:cellulose synthase operon protein C
MVVGVFMVLLFKSWVAVSRTILLLSIFILAGCGSPDQRAQSYYEHGMQLLSQQDYVKAGIEFKNALQLKKDLVGAWRGLLQVESHNRNYQGTVPILRTIVELDPKDIDAKLKLGHFLLLGNALDQALEQANAAIALDNRNPNAHAFRAAVLLKLKDVVGAKLDIQAALDLDPANIEAILVLAAERSSQGDIQGALAILDRPDLDKKQENQIVVDFFKLQLFAKAQDIGKFEELLRKLTESYPKEAAFQNQLFRLYINQKRYDDAEKLLRARAAADPSNVAANLDVVRFLQQFKGPAAAREELMAHVKAGAGDVFDYQLALADFDFAQGKANDSIQLLERLLSNAKSREQELAAQIKLAQFQFQQKKFDLAEPLIASILRKDSRNIDALRLRASIRLQRDQIDAAITDLRQALDDQPKSGDLMLLLAAAYEKNGSIELADKEYADASKVSNFDPTITLNYVSFLRRRGSPQRAEDVLSDLTRRQPNNVAVLSAMAELKLAHQDWKGAQEIAENIKRVNGSQILSDEILAAALSGSGKYDDSIRILERIQTAAPTAVQPMANLVSTLVRAQKLDEAVSFLQSVLKTNPANAEAYVLLGSLQLLKKAPDQAVESFKTAIARQPKDIVGYNALANFYVQNNNLDEAEKTIQAGLQAQPNNFAMHLSYAGVLELKGNYEAAIAENEFLLKQDPGSLIAANNLASLLAEHHTDKASVERAYSLAGVLRKSQIPAFKDTLGWIDYLRGDFKSATALLEEAAAALPNRAVIQYHLGMSYIATGQVAKASEQFKKALALGPDKTLQDKISTAQKKAAM